MRNDNLALLSAILLIVALLAAVTVLLVFRIITLDQVGPFLTVLVVPLTAIAGLPIFKAALSAPSADQLQQVQQQNQQLHGTLNQAVQSLAQVAQPVQVPPQGASIPLPNVPQPVQQSAQVPFPTYGASTIPQMTAPLAAMGRPQQ